MESRARRADEKTTEMTVFPPDEDEVPFIRVVVRDDSRLDALHASPHDLPRLRPVSGRGGRLT